MLKLTIEFQTPVHHGSGFGLAGIIDRAVLRDGNGMPYLAGSAIKGKLRFAAGRVERARGNEPCGPSRWCDGFRSCDYCEVFGSPRRQGRAIFNDAYPPAQEQSLLREAIGESRSVGLLTPGTDVRTSTAIDRRTCTVVKGHLFSTETVSAAIRFEAQIEGRLSDEQFSLLRDAALVLTEFGSGSARGLGLCTYQIEAQA